MTHPIDFLNWVGQREGFKLTGRIVLKSAMSLGLPRLLRIAGRRLVSASAGAPAIILTSGDIEKALKNTQLMYQALEFTVTKMYLDTFCTVADLSLEAEACGCKIQFYKREMPSVITHPVRDRSDVRKLKVPDPESDTRLPINLDAMDYLKRNYSMIKVATVTGPFTLSLQLCGSSIYLDTLKDPAKVDDVVEYSGKVVTKYAEALITHGADIIIIMEPALSQLSQKSYERFAHSAINEIVKHLTKPCILHVCGRAEHLVKYMCNSQCTAFSVDEVDMSNLSKRVPRNSVIVGNLSPILLRHGPIAEIEKKTLELLNETAYKEEMIIAPGCDLSPDTPLNNILAFVNAVKKWKNQRLAIK